MAETLALRANQEPVIAAVRLAFTPEPVEKDDPPGEGHQRVLMVAPTGFGKTTCFTYIAYHAWQMGSYTVIFVHRDELIQQVCERLERYGIPHSVICAGYPYRPWETIQVASVQSYVRRMHNLPQFEFGIFDEAHHCVSKTYIKIMDSSPHAHILGVTATPLRLDGKGMIEAGYTKMVNAAQMRELIADGSLVPPRVYTVPSCLDLERLRTRGGEYVPEDVDAEVDRARIIGNAVDTYKTYCPGALGAAFCSSVEKAKECADKFNAAGVPAASIDGAMPKQERRLIIEKYKHREILMLTNFGIITEGFDLPSIQAVFALKPSKSLAYFLQMAGRAARAEDGKGFYWFFDHAKLIGQPGFGMPDSDRYWELTGKVTSDTTQKHKQCVNCYLWNPANAQKCFGCGQSFAAGGGARKELKQADGQLLLVDDPSLIVTPSKAQELARAVSKARTYEDFLAIEKDRGYQSGWAKLAHRRFIKKIEERKRNR